MQPTNENRKSRSGRYLHFIRILREIWTASELQATAIERERARAELHQSALCKYARIQMQNRI